MRNMGLAFGAAHLVEYQVARDLEQPGREFGPGNIAAGALPNTNEDLLGDVLDVGIAPEHARHRAGHQCLMPLNQCFKGRRVARRVSVASIGHLRHRPRTGRWVGRQGGTSIRRRFAAITVANSRIRRDWVDQRLAVADSVLFVATGESSVHHNEYLSGPAADELRAYSKGT